ncbi:hypothetical protein HMPREF9381_1067 [Streptococcus sanguinis SK72]|uniref:Uncharacterized protein n=1 Tax=Streptococcus sanguinis SK72 TaxID=888809 RepID=F0I295_STRSA|nr:hypothetical protein HMPREF9381_1067 [Streptococcus sanguinis SK72]
MKIKNVVRFRTLASWLGFLALENVQFMFRPNLFPSPLEVTGGSYAIKRYFKWHQACFRPLSRRLGFLTLSPEVLTQIGFCFRPLAR